MLYESHFLKYFSYSCIVSIFPIAIDSIMDFYEQVKINRDFQ